MKAMILAAGYGTRMRELTQHCPKPLLQAGGQPLIVYHLQALARAGFKEVVINTGWLGHLLENAIQDGAQFGLQVFWSREDEPLETAGGIRNALPWLGVEPFLVINGDIWTDLDYRQVHLPVGKMAHLVLVDNPPHNLQGDFSFAAQNVLAPRKEEAYTFAGVGCYHPALFAQYGVDENRLGVLLRDAMRDGVISGELFTGHWWDIGTPERLAQLDEWLQQEATSG